MTALLLALATAAAQDVSLPTGKGLPVEVLAGVHFLTVDRIDDASATYDATFDLRLSWTDLRLRYPPTDAPAGFVDLRGEAAEARLAEIWHPDVGIANLVGDPSLDRSGLRLFPDGKVVLLTRIRGQLSTPFDVAKFPFDHQELQVELVSEREPARQVSLAFHQAEVDFSRPSRDVHVAGWAIGDLDLRGQSEEGWYGDRQARVFAALRVAREPLGALAPIFVPLFASLLIPLLALWLNESDEEGGFKVEAFELANVLIGGLFALIALNFTVNSTYPILAADNPVSLLFGLNYVLLAANIAINLTLMRFDLARRWFGPHVQAELYAWTVWGVPALAVLGTAAILLTAMA